MHRTGLTKQRGQVDTPRRKIFTLAVLAALVGVVAGCTGPSSTPTGLSCTHYNNVSCYYFVSGSTAVACQVDISKDLCSNTKGDYYNYSSVLNNTYLCRRHDMCPQTEKVDPPVSCEQTASYDDLIDEGEAWRVVSRQQSENTTSGPVTVSFVSSSSSEVSIEWSAELKLDARVVSPVVLAGVQAGVNRSVTESVTAAVGNTFTLELAAGKTAHGVYGVKMQVTSGRLRTTKPCQGGAKDHGTVKTYLPISPGWCVWVSGDVPCATIP